MSTASNSVTLGAIIYISVKPIIKIYLIIATGFVLGKKDYLDVWTQKKLSMIVVSVMYPCLIFNNLLSYISISDLFQIGVIVLVSTALFGLGFIGSSFICLGTKPIHWTGGCLSAGLFPNIGDLPIAYLQSLSGIIFTSDEINKGVAYIVIFTACQTVIQFNLGGYMLIEMDFLGQEKSQKIEVDFEESTSCDGEDVIEEIVGKSSIKGAKIFIHLRNGLFFFIENMKRPMSISLLISLALSLVPWTKALFITSSSYNIPNAPDSKPPLSFLLDYAEYISQSTVPVGLLLLGSTLSRLTFDNFSLMITPLLLTILRLVLLPIIGVLINHSLQKLGWYDDDRVLEFVNYVVWGLPNATVMVYLTNYYQPVDLERQDEQREKRSGKNMKQSWLNKLKLLVNRPRNDTTKTEVVLPNTSFQMDYLALTYLFQYFTLVISLPILVTYSLKVQMGV